MVYLLHDTRLDGMATVQTGMVFRVNGSSTLPTALGRIVTTAGAGTGRISALWVMAHGLEGGVHDGIVGESTYALGFGLQLCREGLNFTTVPHMQSLRGLFDQIVLYSCGPANTREGFRNTAADGDRFCREIAGWTETPVIASDTTQIYHMRGERKIIDFGQWEGTVYCYGPDGSRTRVTPGPHEAAVF